VVVAAASVERGERSFAIMMLAFVAVMFRGLAVVLRRGDRAQLGALLGGQS